jgi:hypothetical protein
MWRFRESSTNIAPSPPWLDPPVMTSIIKGEGPNELDFYLLANILAGRGILFAVYV